MASPENDTAKGKPADNRGAESGAGRDGRKEAKARLGRAWYEERNREIVVYYLIAVCFLELIVGAIAFFYGVIHAEPIVEGGPKMARFPWIGWLVAAVLSPVGLLLLLHLSGQFFSRALNGGEAAPSCAPGAEAEVPRRVQRFYAIVRHAPTIVILLGLIALGCAVLFVDSAMQMAMAVGAALKPYIIHIILGVVAFFVIGYIARLVFLARHRRVEQEYAYRMKVLETTGIVIMDRDCVPLHYEDGELKLLARNEDGQLKALPGKGDGEDAAASASGAGPAHSGASSAAESADSATGGTDDVEDAQIVEK